MDVEKYEEVMNRSCTSPEDTPSNTDGTNSDMIIEGSPNENEREPVATPIENEKTVTKATLSYKGVVNRRVNSDILFDDDDCVWSEDEMEISMETNGHLMDLNSNPVEEEEDPLCPVVNIPKKHIGKLRKKWYDSVIVSLLGRNIGFKVLCARIPTLWNLQGDYEVVDLEESHFLFKFMMKEDYHNVLIGGPWIINNHYLIVRKWVPNFNPLESNRVTTALWVRLPRLPIEWFDEKALFQIGSKLGRPIKIDFNSVSSTRGKYARICIEVDLSKSLIPLYKLDGRKYRVESEFLLYICFKCGKIGHKTDYCPLNAPTIIPSHRKTRPKVAKEETLQLGQIMAISRILQMG